MYKMIGLGKDLDRYVKAWETVEHLVKRMRERQRAIGESKSDRWRAIRENGSNRQRAIGKSAKATGGGLSIRDRWRVTVEMDIEMIERQTNMNWFWWIDIAKISWHIFVY